MNLGMKALGTLFLLATMSVARADVMVLVHGYLSGAETWDRSGVSAGLVQNGWTHAGAMRNGPRGVEEHVIDEGEADKLFYNVDLPADAPIVVQTNHLKGILDVLTQRHVGHDLILVGHSAGGVVARLAVVRGDAPSVTKLVTIASPHLGTPLAEYGLSETSSGGPFGMIKGFFGGSDYHAVRNSRAVLRDLARPVPGSLLYWMNMQQHPDIDYVSILRAAPNGRVGDDIVPGYSQDMANVPALMDKARKHFTVSTHGLNIADANVILSALAQ